jgi:hypothetical protein
VLEVRADLKQRLFEAIRNVILATEELRRAKEEYDRIYFVVFEQPGAEKEPVEVTSEPVSGSSAKPQSVADEPAAEDTVPSASEDPDEWYRDRNLVLAYLDGIYPDSRSGREIAESLRIDLDRIVRALKSLEGEGDIEDVGPDQWRSVRKTKQP